MKGEIKMKFKHADIPAALALVRAHELANKVYLWRTDYYFRKLLDRLGVDSSRLDVL